MSPLTKSLLAMLLIGLTALTGTALAAELPAESKKLIFKMAAFEEEEMKKLGEKLLASRAKAVASLQKDLDSASKAGKLDAALALRSAIEALQSENASTGFSKIPNLPARNADQLQRLHQIEVKTALATIQTIDSKGTKVIAVLEKHVADETKAGRLDEAAALRSEVMKMKTTIAERSPAETKLPKVGTRPGAAAGTLPMGTPSLIKGLAAYEFDPLEKQKDDSTTGVHYLEFGPAVSKRKTVKGVNGWRYNSGKNAIAVGYIRIKEVGEYSFSTYNYYDRNALYVKDMDKPICPYRDGGSKGKVHLEPGYVPILAVGYIRAKGFLEYATWKPPGAEKATKIPSDILYYDRRQADELAERIGRE